MKSLLYKHWSIRTKLLLGVSVLLAATVATQSYVASTLFRKDKLIFIHENDAMLVETIASELDTNLSATLAGLRTLASVAFQAYQSIDARERAIQSAFATQANLVDVRILELDASGKNIHREVLHRSNEALMGALTLKEYEEQIARDPYRWPTAERVLLQNLSLRPHLPLLRISVSTSLNQKEDQTTSSRRIGIVGHVHLNAQASLLSRAALGELMLIDTDGQVFLHNDPQKMIDRKSITDIPLLNLIKKSHGQSLVTQDKNASGEERLVALAAVQKIEGLRVVAIKPKSLAFAAIREMIYRSFLVSLQVIAFGVITTMFFARQLTRPLRRLYQATKQVAAGDFSIKLSSNANDEVGALTTSFAHMAHKIIELLKETAVKARMEKELETAHLVQESFFPPSEMQFGDWTVASFSHPASECGGDWWGAFQNKKYIYVLAGDATGHGVPSALLTATVHGVGCVIEHLLNQSLFSDPTPAQIMRTLNFAVSRAGKGRIKMTFLVLRFEKESSTLMYCNASHEMPLIAKKLTSNASEPTYQLKTWDNPPDSILGEAESSAFHDFTDQIEPQEQILLFTDGITERRNQKNQEYGDGRLARAFCRNLNQNAKSIVQNIEKSVLEFAAGTPLHDDLTLICIERRHLTSHTAKAS